MQVIRVECRKKKKLVNITILYLHNILWFFNENKKKTSQKKNQTIMTSGETEAYI